MRGRSKRWTIDRPMNVSDSGKTLRSEEPRQQQEERNGKMAESRWSAGVLIAMLSFLACIAFGMSAPLSVPTVSDWSSVERLENALKAATALPLSSQKLILNTIGEAFVAMGDGPHCNVFGGVDSCVSIPQSSDYARLCDASNQKVDCAYEMEAIQGIHQDPDTIMRDRLKRDNGHPPCDECYKALHKFWCAQTVPACGTFDKVVDEILPMISAVALKKATPVNAVQAAIPRMLMTASLGLPCRKMCNAITDTCGCRQPATFGEVMTSINKQAEADFSTNMSASTSKELFQQIWDVPVCDLFSEDHVPGFVGVCDVASEKSMCSWCSRKNHPTNIHEQIVAQIAQTMSGIMQGGLQTIILEAGGAKHKDLIDRWTWGKDDYEGLKQHKNRPMATVGLLILLAAAIALLVVAAKVHRKRQNQSQYIDLNSMGYTAPIL